ncbi:MFS transporter [Nocardioides pyridinolyticus]
MLFDPVLGSFFWGKTVSSIGIWIHNVVAATVAYQVTGSALIVGLVSVAQFGPQLALAPLSGKWSDQGNAALQIILGRFVTAAGSAGMAVVLWAASGVDGLQDATWIIAFSVVVGIGFALGGPAMQSVVPLMIRPGEMAAAMTLNSVPMTLSRAIGPALGALIVTHFDAVIAFVIASATNVAYAVCVMLLKLPRRALAAGSDGTIRGALRHTMADSRLLMLLVGIAAVGFGIEPTMTLVPSLADELGGGPDLVGWLVSAFGVGSGIGFVLFTPLDRRLRIDTLAVLGLVFIALGLGVAGASVWLSAPVVALGGLAISGLGMTLAFSGITTQIQDRVSDDLRGRVMALWFVAFLGARPLAAASTGYVADVVAIEAAFVAGGVIVGLVALLTGVRRPHPHRAGPVEPQDQAALLLTRDARDV